MIILYLILLMVVNVFSMWLGYILTETKYRLADRYKWLDFQPFNCRKCFTTWTIIIMNITIACLLSSLLYAITGVVFGGAIGLCLHIQEKNKIEK